MAFELPDLSFDEFSRRLRAVSPEPIPDAVATPLYEHYQELRRWNRRLALIGPGTRETVVERHYGEALAALPLVEPTLAGDALDLGSGAGFPGFPVAAARPKLRVTLVEVRDRKLSFLLAGARRASLPVSCLGVRVAAPLPAGIPETLSLVTVRALKLPKDLLAELGSRLSPDGRILLWSGTETPDLPANLTMRREVPLAGSDRRRIVELVRAS